MKLVSSFAACTALLFATPSNAAPSTPTDHERVVSLTRNLEKTPFDPALVLERAWAIDWVAETSDVAVSLCGESLGGLPDDSPHSGEIVVQYMLEMATFLIEHPEGKADAEAQQLAGIEGALTFYSEIVRRESQSRSKNFDRLLSLQKRGELGKFIHTATAACGKLGKTKFNM